MSLRKGKAHKDNVPILSSWEKESLLLYQVQEMLVAVVLCWWLVTLGRLKRTSAIVRQIGIRRCICETNRDEIIACAHVTCTYQKLQHTTIDLPYYTGRFLSKTHEPILPSFFYFQQKGMGLVGTNNNSDFRWNWATHNFNSKETRQIASDQKVFQNVIPHTFYPS